MSLGYLKIAVKIKASSPTTEVFIAFFVAFCVFPVIMSSRVLMHEESSDSRTLFHELGFDFSEQEVPLHRKAAMDRGSSSRKVPGGPDPHHNSKPPTMHRNVAMDIGDSSFREVPTGPNPRHNSGPPGPASFLV
ncbi:hypothetical protein Salat_0215300 [Sesamum alatum]|uniref:CLAVATA3/ESR (CLE)-related protein n=1 Tax=Sesamum alatum TaxID=300844 RepID=A0AAE1YY64_9LAMI|nr:hypothetical protein Salat_0215100 [Sesamum alatum]KAK4438807.1 hypothetical protein Salat_0215300 [Sesamum alatum]